MPITGTELSTIATATSAGAADAAKIALLNSSGLIDDTMLPAPATGDITGVTAGTGLTGGGTSGSVSLAADFGTGSGKVTQGNDSRLSDSRTPTAHATSHKSGGSDAIKLDELAAPTDVTTLNATTSAHGLLKKLSGVVTQYLNGNGAFATPTQQTWYFFFDEESIHDVGQVEGDLAIITGAPPGNGKIYLYTSGTWTNIGHIQSAAAVGIWTSGTAAASGGSDGNYYLRTTTGEISLKTSGTWSVILTVPAALTYSTGLNLTGTTLTVVYGSSGTTACVGNDARLSDDRTASGIKTATTTVATASATAPSAGQVLTATSTTAAQWSTPSTTANGLASATTTVAVSAATAPTTGQVLTATDSTHATWQTATGGAASDIATTGASVNVSAAAPPATGKVLTATDATHATWQTPAGGGGAANPYIDAPASPHADNDEFTGWSGWTVWDGTANAVLTDDGDGTIDPWTYPASGHYRRKTVGSLILLQFPKTGNVIWIYKAITPASNMLVWSRFSWYTDWTNTTPTNYSAFGLWQDSSSRPGNSSAAIEHANISSTGRRLHANFNASRSMDAATPTQGVNPPSIYGVFEVSTTSRRIFTLSDYGDLQHDGTSPSTASVTTAYVAWRMALTASPNNASAMCPIMTIDYFRRKDSATAWVI